MTKKNKKHILIFEKIKCTLILFVVLNSFDSFSQIPDRAISIADSVCQTRLYCASTRIELEDSIYLPVFKNEYQDRKTVSYFFQYKVYIKGDIETNLNISIEHDFKIKFISGFPDSSYKPSPCKILPIQQLWNEARRNGLKTKYKKCNYSIDFDDDEIYISFHEKKTRWDLDHYSFNGITGEYLAHQQMNVTF